MNFREERVTTPLPPDKPPSGEASARTTYAPDGSPDTSSVCHVTPASTGRTLEMPVLAVAPMKAR